MRAAILVEQKMPLVLADIKMPRLQYGQALVKVKCSGICGSQIGEIDGVKGPDKFLPHLLGHEGGGIVEEIGPCVTRVKKGDHVVMHWRKGFGIEALPPKYEWGDKVVNAGWVTTFNEYTILSENRVTQIPKDIDFEIAALFGCAVTTGLGVINNNSHLKIGESIVVLGSGGVGLNAIQGANMVSAYPIIAVDIYENKLDMAKYFGATHTINSRDGNLKEQLYEILDGQYADVVVDNTGIVEMIELAYEITGPQGRTILVGVPKKGEKISIYSLPLHFGKILTGSYGGESNPTEDIARYIRLYQSGRLKLRELITDRFCLTDINTAIEKMRKGEIAGRCMIKLSDNY